MLKSNGGKSTVRRPLIDISNGGKPWRPLPKKKAAADGGADGGGDALDRLLLARSDLSNLVGEIDELIAEAMRNKTMDRKASRDIDSLRNVLSDMHSSLKPWVSRLRKAFGITSALEEKEYDQTIRTNSITSVNKEETAYPDKSESELDPIVSPSPLVSWRAGSCTMETGRQLFLLTPLPEAKVASSKFPLSSQSTVRVLRDNNPHDSLGLPGASTISVSSHNGFWEEQKAKVPTCNVSNPCTAGAKVPTYNVSNPCTAGTKSSISQGTSLSLKSKSKKDTVSLLTPCLKTSAPRNYLLHDSENIPEASIQDNDSKGSDDLISGSILDGLTSRYQELLGLRPTDNLTNKRKESNQTLDWFLSPPKTCVLLEPTEEKPVLSPVNNGMLVLATPLWKDVESTVHKGKRAGENTLKKELWTRFEEVSKDGLHFDASVFQKTEQKRFLDMLEEACEISDCRDAKY